MTEVVCPQKGGETECPPTCPFYNLNKGDQMALRKILESSCIPTDVATQQQQAQLEVLSHHIKTQINNRKRARAHAVGSPPERLFCLLEEMVTKATAP